MMIQMTFPRTKKNGYRVLYFQKVERQNYSKTNYLNLGYFYFVIIYRKTR